MKICQETEEKYGMTVSQQVVAAIAETVWRQTESFAVDLELFAKLVDVAYEEEEDVDDDDDNDDYLHAWLMVFVRPMQRHNANHQ
jgi:hypothetical protein